MNISLYALDWERLNCKLDKRQITSSVNENHVKQIAVYSCSFKCNKNRNNKKKPTDELDEKKTV